MRKTRRRRDRGPTLGWEAAHARLEERFLLSGTAPSPQPDLPTTEVVSLDGPSGSDTPVGVGGWAEGEGETIAVAGLSAQSRGFHTSFPDTVAVSGGTVALSASGDVRTANVGGPVITLLSPAKPAEPISALALAMFSDLGHAGGPPWLGGPGGPEQWMPGSILVRLDEHAQAFEAVNISDVALLADAPAIPCASMASIVGAVEVGAVVLDAPAAPAQPATAPGSTARLDGVRSDAADPSVTMTAFAGATASPSPDDANGAVPTSAPAPGTGGEVADAGAGEAGPAEMPAPIALGLRLTAPLLDAAGWDEAVGQLVEGVDDLLAGIAELGGEASYVPWMAAAGLAVGTAEAARRLRSRPALAAAFVDGSVSVVDPEEEPARGSSLSGSVRRLLARGLSRWTTRR